MDVRTENELSSCMDVRTENELSSCIVKWMFGRRTNCPRVSDVCVIHPSQLRHIVRITTSAKENHRQIQCKIFLQIFLLKLKTALTEEHSARSFCKYFS